MKYRLLFASLVLASTLTAQIEERMPVRTATAGWSAPATAEQLSALDETAIATQIEADEIAGNLPKFAKLRPVGFNLSNSGNWLEWDEDGRLWRLRIRAEKAKGISLYYDDFFIPEGASLHVYSKDRRFVKGAFTSKNNRDHGKFASGVIPGEEIVLEYYEPFRVMGEGRISISDVGHAYRFVRDNRKEKRDFGSSQSCQINVNCSEGDNWEGQRDAAVRIELVVEGDVSWCSGAVINNLAEDWKPYILTAMHCGTTVPANELTSQSDFDQWIFYFNYESPNCNNPSSEGSLASNSMVGADIIAHSNDGGGDEGSDFLLLELQNSIPTDYNPYYAGWDASGNTSSSGVGVHHPAGDIKKISTYSSALVSGSFGGVVSGTHWNATWVATSSGHGVTEGGSSGSPLFNSQGRIIGDLTGGSSFCSTPSQPDEYGKLSYSWTSNGTAAVNQLKPWLDPDNTGATTQGGAYRFPASVPEGPEANSLLVYPNPSSGIFYLKGIPVSAGQQANFYLRDALGKVVRSGSLTLTGNQEASLDLSELRNGFYLLELEADDQVFNQKIQLF